MSDQDKPADLYALVIADLKTKRAQIEHTIASLEVLRGMATTVIGMSGIGHATLTPLNGPDPSAAVQDGAFLGMTIVEATKALLAARKKPQSTAAIAEAIRIGGVVLASENPSNTVGSVLNRQARGAADIVSVSRGVWGLAAWYPNPGRFAKKRDFDKGEDEATPTTKAEDLGATSPSRPHRTMPPEVTIPSDGAGLFQGDAAPAAGAPSGGDLDDEIPF